DKNSPARLQKAKSRRVFHSYNSRQPVKRRLLTFSPGVPALVLLLSFPCFLPFHLLSFHTVQIYLINGVSFLHQFCSVSFHNTKLLSLYLMISIVKRSCDIKYG